MRWHRSSRMLRDALEEHGYRVLLARPPQAMKVFEEHTSISLVLTDVRMPLMSGPRRYEISTEAYDLYLRARAMTAPQHRRSIRLFKRSPRSSFAPGYAVCRDLRIRSVQSSPTADLANMRTAAEKAIRLDPLLAEAHDALGIAYARDAKWNDSEKSFRRAIELDRNRSMSYADFVNYLLLVLGRIEEALHELRIAEKADPLSILIHARSRARAHLGWQIR